MYYPVFQRREKGDRREVDADGAAVPNAPPLFFARYVSRLRRERGAMAQLRKTGRRQKRGSQKKTRKKKERKQERKETKERGKKKRKEADTRRMA